MRYKNNKTGAVVDSSFKISGDDWELEESNNEKENDVEDTKEQKQPEGPKESEKNEEAAKAPKDDEPIDEEIIEDDGFNGITVKQIKQELDAFGIKYDQKANKKALYELMIKGK